MINRMRAVTCGILLVFLVPLIAVAQDPGIEQQDAPDPSQLTRQWAQADAPVPPGAPPAPDRRHLEQFRMLKLLELLDLQEEQEMQFLVAFRAMRDKQMVLQEQRETYLKRLGEGIREDTISDAAIEDLVLKIIALKKEHLGVSEEFFVRMDRLLTAEQLGKLVIFNERFEYELIEKLRGFRDRRGPHGGGKRNMQNNNE